MLTAYAVKRRALALHDAPNRCAALSARFGFAVIDKIILLKIAGLPIGANKIAQTAAALLDGRAQYSLYRNR